MDILLEKIAKGAPLPDILCKVIEAVESQIQNSLCSIFTIDSQRPNRLCLETAPNLPPEFSQFIDGTLIGDNISPCGRAAALNEVIITEDIVNSNFSKTYRDLAAQLGLRACWSMPITNHEAQVLGTLDLYYQDIKSPYSTELASIAQIACLTGIAIERQKSDKKLCRHEAFLWKAQQVATIGYWVFDLASQTITWSPQMFRLHGLDPTLNTPSFPKYLAMLQESDRQQFKCYFERAVTEGVPYTIEYCVVRGDGEICYHECRVEVERDINGQVIRLLGTSLDITERKKNDIAVKSLIAGTATTTGKDFFPALVRNMAAALEVSYASISEVVDDKHLEVMAFWGKDSLLPTFEYAIGYENKTPCDQILQQGRVYSDELVQSDFPDDEFLNELGITSYLGCAIYDSQDKVIGMLCIFDTKPIKNPKHAEQVLRVFASRSAAELERQHAKTELERLNYALEAKVEARTAELQASRAYYQGILSDQTELICRFYPNGVLTFVNAAYCQCFNKSLDELIGKCFIPLIPEADRYIPQESLNKLSIDNPVDVCEHRVFVPEGNIRWHQWTNRALFDDAGNFIEYQAVGRDITDRKKAEQALEKLIAGTAATVEQDFFPALVRYISEALNISYVFVSERIGQHEMTILAFWPSDIVPFAFTYDSRPMPCQKILDEGRIYCEHSVQEMFPEDDLLIELNAQSYLGVAIRNAQGQVVGDLCIFHPDIIREPQRSEQILNVFAARAGAEIERQRAKVALEQLNQSLEIKVADRTAELRDRELSLRASEERYASLTAAAPVGIFRHDAEGNCIYVNNRCCEICGLDQEALMDNQWQEALHPEDRDRVLAAWMQLTASNTLFKLEYRFQLSDGTVRWVYTQSVPEKDNSGQVIGYVGTITDISDRKHAELALQNLIEGTAATTGQDFFPALVKYIAIALNVSSAMVSVKKGDELEVLAFWSNGKKCQTLTYNPQDAPCELVLKEGVYHCENSVCLKFPEDLFLIERKAESYMGIALYDSQETVIGVLCVFDPSPILNPERAECLLKVFGSRAAAEIERQRSEVAIKRQLATIEAAVDGIGILENERYLYVNQAHLSLFGYAEVDDLIGKSWKTLYSSEEIQRFERSILPHLYIDRVWQGEAIAVRSDGSTFAQGISLTLTEENLVICVCRDISDLKKAQALIVHNSLHDPLTELPNRALLLERIELAINRTQRMEAYKYAVLFIDLDRFKVINDSLGHAAGDQLLVTIAQRLQRHMRKTDLVARLGGDEFILLIENIDSIDEVIQIIEHILLDFKEPIAIDGRNIFASFSIGIVLGDKSYEQATDLIRDADIAMYRAKAQQGSSYSFFDSEMHVQAINRLTLETDLRKAISKEEFVIHYQPIVDLYGGQLIGFEALVRWQHPNRGLVYPDKFIPIAEEIGLVEQIDAWVMHHACRQIAIWNNDCPGESPLQISINLSANDLHRATLIRSIDEVLEKTQINGNLITLEITETMLIEDIEETIDTLSEIASKQIRVSIDDFGTGYSSLNYLHRLPVHSLKIDRSFIGELNPERRNSKVVSTILSLSNQLGLTTVAEGVETQQQLQYLQKSGCQFGQGYLFSPPLATHEIEVSLLKTRIEQLCRENMVLL